MGLCGSKQSQPAGKGKAGAAAASSRKSDAAAAAAVVDEKVGDGAAAHPFDREFHPDSEVFVFKEKTPNIWDIYDKGPQIGERGYYGRAYCATHKATGERVVAKKISKRRHGYTPRMMDAYRKEIQTLRMFSHPNLIRLIDAFETRESLYIVMEMASGGELFAAILKNKNYSEREAAPVFRQLLEGLAEMSRKNVLHGDIKPSNCVFGSDGRTLKIIDFGMARMWHAADREKFHTPAGTVQYSSPEVIGRSYNLASDMWSAGVVLYVMLIGFPPFYDAPAYHMASNNGDAAAAERASSRNVRRKIMAGFQNEVKRGYGPWWSSEKGVPMPSEGARDLVARLLSSDVKTRLTAEEALLHPWVQGTDVSDTPLGPMMFESLKQFSAHERFQQHVLSLMADIVPDTELDQLHQTFKSIDTNGDGSISIDEMHNAVEAGKWPAADAATIERLFDMADLDKNGVLDIDEIMSTLVHMKLVAKEERLWDAFQQIDSDGNGYLSPDELVHVLQLEHVDVAHEMIEKMDTDKDGRIKYDEFLDVWRTNQTNKF